jgi:hypothetical protein
LEIEKVFDFMEKIQIQDKKSKSVGSELIIPIVALFFTIYYFFTILDAPWTAQVAAFIVGALLIIFVIAFIVRSIKLIKTGGGSLGFEDLIAPKNLVSKRLRILGLTFAFIFTVPYLGFTITTFLFLSVAMMVLSNFQNKRFIILLSAGLSLGGYLLFILAFETRFPAGPFESFMKGLF